MTKIINPAQLARRYVDEIAADIGSLPRKPVVRGLIATDDEPSIAYARATEKKFSDIGIEYQLVQVERLALEQAIVDANTDPGVHGIFIYFPVFNNQQDTYLRNLVDFAKDIEAGSVYWTRKLYANDRQAVTGDASFKALLPCTPLAIIKILTELGIYTDAARPLQGLTVTIFNRSEVIGRPLAVMLSNDGALVNSFDVDGPLEFRDATPRETTVNRQDALASSDIIITGVPNEGFPPVSANEVSAASTCLNFSSVANFADDIEGHVAQYVPRVGPMTVAMCMRNTLRLYRIFHEQQH